MHTFFITFKAQEKVTSQQFAPPNQPKGHVYAFTIMKNMESYTKTACSWQVQHISVICLHTIPAQHRHLKITYSVHEGVMNLRV